MKVIQKVPAEQCAPRSRLGQASIAHWNISVLNLLDSYKPIVFIMVILAAITNVTSSNIFDRYHTWSIGHSDLLRMRFISIYLFFFSLAFHRHLLRWALFRLISNTSIA